MDCSNTPDGRIQPSLEIFYRAIEKSYGSMKGCSPSLKYLLEQGVLLLNTELTCKLNKKGSHKGYWDSFQKFFLEYMSSKTGIVYVLSGEISQSIKGYIQPLGNHIFETEHPAAAARQEREWNCFDIFKRIDLLTGDKIYWKEEDFVKFNEPPF